MTLAPLFPELRARRPRYTRAFRFTPSSLVALAREDIARKRANRRLLIDNNGIWPISQLNKMGFDHRDIRCGDEPADVLRRAIIRARKHPRYRQTNRAALYGDLRVLGAALRMAKIHKTQEERHGHD